MKDRRQQQFDGRHRYADQRHDLGAFGGPPHLRFAVETLPVRDFDVVICRVSDFGSPDGEHADFRLVAMTNDFWYQVWRHTDLDGVRSIAWDLERPTDRTHGLCLLYETRTANLTHGLYRLTGLTTVTASFMRVHWAPKGSAFEVGAEYSRPLDARHPRRVTEADLEADARRRTALRQHWQQRAADAYDLFREVYEVSGDDGEPEMATPRR